MKTLSLSEVKMKLSQFVEEVSNTDNPISVTRNGEAVAVLMSQELYDGWMMTLEIIRDTDFYKSVLHSMHELNRGEGLSLTIDELFRERTGAKRTFDQPVRVKALPQVREAFTNLHPDIQTKVHGYLKKIANKNEKGILLKNGLDGLAFFRVGQYKILYRWKVRSIELVMLDVRETAYRDRMSL